MSLNKSRLTKGQKINAQQLTALWRVIEKVDDVGQCSEHISNWWHLRTVIQDKIQAVTSTVN